jgi:hypothetical protein
MIYSTIRLKSLHKDHVTTKPFIFTSNSDTAHIHTLFQKETTLYSIWNQQYRIQLTTTLREKHTQNIQYNTF